MRDDADAGAVRQSRNGSVLRITLDRPTRRNSLSHTMIDDLVAIMTAAATQVGQNIARSILAGAAG